jgi:8-oxo-dGTP pyrophosphatase MutT (NUDIX family)
MDTHIVAKTLVFNDRNQVLLLLRSDDDPQRAGGFDLPGGQVEAGEDYKAGAIREALEEAALVLDPLSTHLVYSLTTLGRGDTGIQLNLVRLFFVTRVPDSTVVLSHEHKAYNWYSIDDALARTDHPLHREVLAHIRTNNIAPEFWT